MTIISKISFDLFMPNEFLFFQPPIPFGRFVYHLFYGGHTLGNLLIKPFFASTHFHELQFYTRVFPFCIFISLVDNIHIIGLSSIIPFGFELYFLCLLLCILWFNFASVQFVCPPVCFLIFLLMSSFVTLWIILGFQSFILDFFFFISSFLQDTLDKDVFHVDVILKLKDVQITFGILSVSFSPLLPNFQH